MVARSSISFSCWGRLGEWLGDLQLADSRGDASLVEDDEEISISENGNYALHLRSAPNVRALFSPPVMASRVGDVNELFGTLGSYVGLGAIQLGLNNQEGEALWRRLIRIRPVKFKEVSEFETMVSEICAWKTALALDMRSNASAPWSLIEPVHQISPEEELSVLRAAIEKEGLFKGLDYISRNAQSRLNRDDALVRLGEGGIDPHRYGAHLARGGRRFVIPSTHPLRQTAASLPIDMPTMRKVDTTDTPANRFAKHVAVSFSNRIKYGVRRGVASNTSIGRWAKATAGHLDRISSTGVFAGLGSVTRIELGDPAIQRRHGYRAVLRAYLAARGGLGLVWQEMSEFVYAETRDVPRLYELWCLLRVRQAIEGEFDIRLSMDHFVIEESGIRVRRGSVATGDRLLTIGSRRFSVLLWYNRSFLPTSLFQTGKFHVRDGAGGTWSKTMKPDFSIELVPEGSNEGNSHSVRRFLHLDAKYRLKSIPTADDTTDFERTHAADDIDKMHAYLSSIADSAGSHVLYPGDVTAFFKRSDSLDSVGAIAAPPGRMEEFGPSLRSLLEATFAP